MKRFGLAAVTIAALITLITGCPSRAENADTRTLQDAAQQQVIHGIRSGNEAPQAQGYQGQQANQPTSRMSALKTLPQGVYAMQKAQVVDQAGFAQPLVAATLLVPYGWRTEGGIIWGAYQQCGPDYANNWAMTSPDGSSSMRVLPAANWTATRINFPMEQQPLTACESASYSSAREYLTAIAPRFFPQSRVIDYRSIEDEVKPLKDMMAQLPSISNQNMQSKMIADGGEILVAYQLNGREMRATLSTIAVISHVRFADIMNPGQISMETITGAPSQITIVTAPNGQLDFGLRKRVQKSVRFTPEWSQAIAQYHAQKNKTIMDTNRAAHATRMHAIHQTSQIMNGIYEDRQIASDRNQREFIESIRGVETYNDPIHGGPIQLDNTYDHAWRVQNADAYILTNDPNFNPGQYDIQAQQLQIIR